MIEVGSGKKCLTDLAIKRTRFPAEWEHHTRSVMIWPASEDLCKELLSGVRDDVANIAKAISYYEEVVVLAEPTQVKDAEKALGSKIKVIPMEIDDLWARDTLPAFVENGHEVYGIDLHFNGWGDKQNHEKDAKVAMQLLEMYNLSCVSSPVVCEGGALETDGLGTLIATESSIVNENRNPGKNRDQIEKELKEVLGVTKIIWITGVKGGDITDAHIDALVRFVSPGVIVLSLPPKIGAKVLGDDNVWVQCSNQAKEVLKNATDVCGQVLKIHDIYEPNPSKITGKGQQFLSSYVNYYVANGAVIVPAFGDKEADKEAQDLLRKLYPGREIVPVNINNLAALGGGIHCSVHDMIGNQT